MTFFDSIFLVIGILIVLSLYRLFRLIVQILEQLDTIREILIWTRDYAKEICDLLKKPPEREQGK